jgi:hypothetical protein
MRIVAADRNLITITATRHEITTIVAAARMALELINADIDAPADARAQLARALRQYDTAIARPTTPLNGSIPVAPE